MFGTDFSQSNLNYKNPNQIENEIKKKEEEMRDYEEQAYKTKWQVSKNEIIDINSNRSEVDY